MQSLTLLLTNNSARVPFTIIGILFLLMASAFSTHLSKMDREMAASLSSTSSVNNADKAYRFAAADLARIINYAGMEASKQMGQTPVIVIEPTAQYNLSTSGECTSAEFNRNWARSMIMHVMNSFIQTNYMYNSFNYGGYAVNVEPLTDWKDINLTNIYMSLDREFELPGLAPNETYVTYWKVDVPLNISIVDLESGDIVNQQDIRLENLITCRYPMLESLTYEYEERLNASNEVMIETTAFAMPYTFARGYLQYYKPGGPGNIVDNKHLPLMVNGALMLDQGLLFNSVDTGSIIEYVMQSKRVLYDKNDIDLADVVTGIELNNSSFEIDPQQNAANSTADPENASAAMEEAMHFDYNATPITNLMTNDSLPGGSQVSIQILNVIPQVYDTILATGISRQTTIEMGEHDGYDSDHSTGEWGEPDSMVMTDTVPRDPYVPGNLYGEIWNVTWTRDHVWRDYYEVEYDCLKEREVDCIDDEGNPDTCTEQYWDICTRIEYREISVTDTRMDSVTITIISKQNSLTDIQLNYNDTILSTMNDVEDAYSSQDVEYSTDHTDPCLEEAYLSYKNDVYDPDKEDNIKDMSLNGDNYNPQDYQVDAPDWLLVEAKLAVDNITRQIRNDIHLDADINYMNYPNPADAMRAAANDLTDKIKSNQSRYVNKAAYINSINGLYSSVSAKVISQVCEWYVDEVLYQVNETYMNAAGMIDDQIDDDFGDSADDVRSANEKGAGLLGRVLGFPVGLTMKAEHVMANGTHYDPGELAYWDENVTLGVDMEPDYLFAEDNDGKQLINLGVRNICLMGPTGVPVLPPPNYVVHFNSWIIDVEGRIDEFMVFDADNECHPNPMFGHEAQVYRREEHSIYDPYEFSFIGYNIPIEFSFTTGTFIIVPPSVKGIGDRLGGIDESSSEYGNILRR
jgi:hypothetical protein